MEQEKSIVLYDEEQKNRIKKALRRLERIELLLATVVLLIAIMFLNANVTSKIPIVQGFAYGAAAIVYAAVLVFTQAIWSRYFANGRVDWGIALTVLCFLSQWGLLILALQGIKNNDASFHDEVIPLAFGISIVTFALLIPYRLVSYNILKSFLADTNLIRAKVIREMAYASGAGLLLFLSTYSPYPSFSILASLSILYGYCLFAAHYYLILPQLAQRRLTKGSAIMVSVLASLVCVAFFSGLIQLLASILIGRIGADYSGFQILVCVLLGALIVPLTWVIFMHNQDQQRQVKQLRKDLGRSDADFKMLQLQINPHFLFNIMNTLYGIALQEHAERTANGIQKLSGMMRFMIHEHQQDQILLTQELQYLAEYIELQKLRIVDLPHIRITQDIPSGNMDKLTITPMLLIPFIENAFKHGIDVSKESWIKINLEVKENVLKLHVSNSTHASVAGEYGGKGESGIGLDNVKNRLALVYPDGHLLHIERTKDEHFVFLTLNLEAGQ